MTAPQPGPPPDARVVLVTADPAQADALALGLVEARLAACVNSLPVRSVYRWDGAIQQAEEVLLLVKTTSDRLPALAAWISEHHAYDNPEVLALPVDAGAPSYLAWLAEETLEP